ncbi:MAG: patatin family protein [Bryobacterales bacterium]|nr:patatin family protein [Bryobacterales bacterium]
MRKVSSINRSKGGSNGSTAGPSIGLALGGGFARGIAHVGVLRVFARYGIPVHAIAGVSAGAIVASAFASGASADEIGLVGASMRFKDVASWRLSAMGLAKSECMTQFLRRLLKRGSFEEMQIPLAVVATDLATGNPVIFSGTGDVSLPIRASCSYPGLFQPVVHQGRFLVDGAMSMEIPAKPLRALGVDRVISVHLPMRRKAEAPDNMLQVVNRCFQIMQRQAEGAWRRQSDLVIAPDVSEMAWDAFGNADQLIEAGEKAALAALPKILSWTAAPTGRFEKFAPSAA